MPRQQPSGLTRFFRRMIGQLLSGHSRSNERKSQRHLKFEPLEGRQLLASDLASLTGIVSLASPANPVVGATINLYLDDGDGVFEPGAGDGAATADVTDGTGAYQFDRLVAGSYWIEQPAQTVGAVSLGAFVKPLVTISAGQAGGTVGTSFDDFNDSSPQTVVADNSIPTNNGFADHAGALGGERDMIVVLTNPAAGESVTLDSQANRLMFSSTLNAQGDFTVVYDGNDDDGDTLAPTGLAGANLTANSANAVKVRVQADQASATVRLRVYTDATNFSDSAAFTIPGTDVATDAVFYFADFATGSGAAGPATFSNVGAVELLVETNTNATDGLVTLLGAFAPTVITQDFSNNIDLNLDKSVNNPTPNIGQQVTFTLTLTNPAGGAAATGVVITDDVPTGLTIDSVTASAGTSYDQGTDLWTVGTLASGATATLQIVATVTSSAQITNTATITSAGQPDSDTADNTDTAQVDAPAAADLSVTITPPSATPGLGQNATFTVTLANGGPDAATNIVVTDVIPTGLVLQTSTPEVGNYSNHQWTISSLASGEDVTLTIVLRADDLAQLTYSAQVTASDLPDPDSTVNDGVGDDFDSATVDAVSADLSLDKQASSLTPAVGQPVTFTLTLTNSGPDSATGVVVRDQLPSGLTFVSATTATGSYDQTTGLWTVGTVSNTAPVTLQIVATVTSSAPIANSAQVSASGVVDPDSTPNDGAGDDFDTITIDAPAAADLSVTSTPSSATPNFNSNVTYTIVVTNGGPDQATGVVVNDLLPAGLVFVSSNVTQGSYVSGTGVWTVGTINSGSTATLTLVARVNTTASIDNVAQVTASGVADPDSTPNDNTGDDRAVATVNAPAAADLRLAKSASAGIVNIGQPVTFTLTLTNDGPDSATGVTVSDQLPAGLSFVSANATVGSYDSNTGIWTVGTVNNGGSATLTIVATLTTAGAKVNTAQVTASNEFDPDSTPNDNTGDDRATTSVASARLSKRLFLAR